MKLPALGNNREYEKGARENKMSAPLIASLLTLSLRAYFSGFTAAQTLSDSWLAEPTVTQLRCERQGRILMNNSEPKGC
jgi:hypothetical protein